MKDYYSILGLPSGASKDAIKKAYRRLAMQYHPDRNPTSEAKQKFILITEAYDNLLAGRGFSFSRIKSQDQKPSAPTKAGYRNADEKRREANHLAHQQLLRKFQEVRTYFHNPIRCEAEKKKMQNKIYAGYAICAALGAGIFIPQIFDAPQFITVSFPIALFVILRTWFKLKFRKLRVEMIYGEKTIYSYAELREFFNVPDPEEKPERSIGNDGAPDISGWM